MRWFWGTLLIVIGLAYLSFNLHIINGNQLEQITQFWPLLLVIWGISLIFRRWKFGWVITTVAFFALLALVAFAITSNYNMPNGYNFHTNNESTTKSNFSASLDPNTSRANISVNTGAVNLTMDSKNTDLISGTLASDYLKPDLNVSSQDNSVTAELNTNSSGEIWPNGKNKLDIHITNQIPVKLDINAGASKLDLDLTNIKLSGLDINTGATNIDATLGNQIENNAKIKIQTGASNITIKIPEQIGVKITNESPLSKTTFHNYTQTSNNTFESKDYSTKNIKIELEISAGVSSIEVK